MRYAFGGLIFGGAYTRRGLFSEFYGILRYLPIRFHFLHFEITVNGNTAPKIIAGPWSDAKRVKMAEKPQKEEYLKAWLNKEMEEFQKLGEY